MSYHPRFATTHTPHADLGRTFAGASWSTPLAGATIVAVVRPAATAIAALGNERKMSASRDRSGSHDAQRRIAQRPLYGRRARRTGAGFEYRWRTP